MGKPARVRKSASVVEVGEPCSFRGRSGARVCPRKRSHPSRAPRQPAAQYRSAHPAGAGSARIAATTARGGSRVRSGGATDCDAGEQDGLGLRSPALRARGIRLRARRQLLERGRAVLAGVLVERHGRRTIARRRRRASRPWLPREYDVRCLRRRNVFRDSKAQPEQVDPREQAFARSKQNWRNG